MSQCVTIAIVPETSCSGCAVASVCHSSEKQEKDIDVACTDAARYAVGQEVVLVGQVGLGLRATLWAYAVPVVLLMAVLMLTYSVTRSEGEAAVAAVLSLIPYYMVLYLLRERLQRTFSFRIKTGA